MFTLGNEQRTISIESEVELRNIISNFFSKEEFNSIMNSLEKDSNWSNENITITTNKLPNDKLIYNISGNSMYIMSMMLSRTRQLIKIRKEI